MAQPVKDRLVADARTRIAAKLALIAGETAPEKPAPKDTLAPTFTLQGEQANEYFGLDSCIGDINGDGVQDIVVGSPGVGTFGDPQRGRVSIWYGTATPAGTPDYVLDGVDVYGRFGSSCAVLDFNLDGIQDLAVGAPSNGGKNLVAVVGNYTGAVHIFFGTGNQILPFSPTPSISISSPMSFASLGCAKQSSHPY